MTRHHSLFIIKPIETKQLVPNKGSCSVWFGYNYTASSSIFIIILYVNEMCLRNNSHTAIVPFTLWPLLNLVFCSQLPIVHAVQFLSIPNPDVISRVNHYLIYKQTKLIVLSTNLLSCMIWYAGLHVIRTFICVSNVFMAFLRCWISTSLAALLVSISSCSSWQCLSFTWRKCHNCLGVQFRSPLLHAGSWTHGTLHTKLLPDLL